jgi:Cdc6-like AAA superfamily ATPase
MNPPSIKERMDFIERFANDGRGKTFTIKAVWREYTGQKVGMPLRLKVNGLHINIMSVAIKELHRQGKVRKIRTNTWEWIGD